MISKTVIKIERLYHLEKKATIAPVEYIEHKITVDDELYYSDKQKSEIYINNDSPIRAFENWLLANKECESGSDVRCNGRDCAYFVGHRRFKAFNFKQKFFNILRNKFFLRNKTAAQNKIVR